MPQPGVGSRAAAAGAAVAGPLALLAVPKCPLCLLPLLAVVGVGLPPGRFLDFVVVAVAAAWLAGLLALARSPLLPGIAAGAVSTLLVGRLLAADPVLWGGVALMFFASAMSWFSGRPCTGACRAAAHASLREEEMPCLPTIAP